MYKLRQQEDALQNLGVPQREMMDNSFLRRQLGSLHCLDPDAIELLFQILRKEPAIGRGLQWINEDSEICKAYVIADGWAIRYKLLEDGRRQILNFLIPGDMIGYFALLFRTSVYAVEPLTPMTVHSFTPECAFDAFRQSPQLAVALSWLAAQAERQLDEQLVRIGRRRAKERMAHLFMELNHRLLRTGAPTLAAGLFPLTQPLLADALGMSHVHTHRTFRELVKDGLVSLHDGKVMLRDIKALSRLADFDAGYLEQKALPSSTRTAFSRQPLSR